MTTNPNTEPSTPGPTGQALFDLFQKLRALGCQQRQLNKDVEDHPIRHGERLSYSYLNSVPIPTGPDLIELPVHYSTEAGTDYDVANQRSLVKEFGRQTFVHLFGGHYARGLAIPLDIPLPGDPDSTKLARLVEAISWLTVHDLLDEDEHGHYVAELVIGAWDLHLGADMPRELQPWAPDQRQREHLYCLDTVEQEAVREAYYGYEHNDWDPTSATTVTNRRHHDAVRHVAREVFGWEVPSR